MGERAAVPAPKTLKIFYTNAQSIVNKINELSAYLVGEEPDLILITETWCNPSISDAALTIPIYQLECDLRRDRSDTGQGIGGGILVYSRVGLRLLPYDKFKTNEFNQFSCFTLLTEGRPLHFFVIYRPPSSDMSNMVKLVDILQNLDDNTVLIGDFNLPNINWQDTTATKARARRLVEAMANGNLVQLVHFPTHQKGNTLDLVITNSPDKIVHIEDGGKLGKSDHCILNIGIVANPLKKVSLTKRPNWSKANVEELRAEILAVNWVELFGNEDVESCWEKFKGVIKKGH